MRATLRIAHSLRAHARPPTRKPAPFVPGERGTSVARRRKRVIVARQAPPTKCNKDGEPCTSVPSVSSARIATPTSWSAGVRDTTSAGGGRRWWNVGTAEPSRPPRRGGWSNSIPRPPNRRSNPSWPNPATPEWLRAWPDSTQAALSTALLVSGSRGCAWRDAARSDRRSLGILSGRRLRTEPVQDSPARRCRRSQCRSPLAQGRVVAGPGRGVLEQHTGVQRPRFIHWRWAQLFLGQ